MTRWEFHEVTVHHGHEYSGRQLLEQRGTEGWQIGGVVNDPYSRDITFYMQRATESEGNDNAP